MHTVIWRKAGAVLLAAALAGCVSVPVIHRPAGTQPLPSDLARYYAYTPVALDAKTENRKEADGYTIERLVLSPAAGDQPRPIKIDWYRPARRGRFPVVILSPILAGNDLYVKEFARFYAARGLHAMIVYRPKEVFSADRDLKDIETHFKESVTHIRHAIDWLQRQDSVDPDRIGSFGISLGSMLAVILAAVEPRVSAHVFGLPAAHVPEILMASQDKAIRKRRRAVMEKRGWTEQQTLEELRRVFVSEPVRFAPAVDRDRSLMIVGLFDRVLGFGRSLDLWRAMDKPRLVVLPTGHYTAYFATPYLKTATYSHFRKQFRKPR